MVAAFPGIGWNDDPEAAVWVRFALRPWAPPSLQIASLVPADFSAHGRVLHPIRNGDHPVRWSEYAAAHGRSLDARTRFNELVGLPDDFVRHATLPRPWHPPDDGHMPRSVCAAIATTLGAFTSTPDDCLFALWVGYGRPEVQRLGTERRPQLALEHRDCYLFRGPVDSAIAFEGSHGWFQSPTAWWPADRAWFVATEVDGYSSYVGGSAEAIDALIASAEVEVLACDPNDPIDPSPYPLRAPD